MSIVGFNVFGRNGYVVLEGQQQHQGGGSSHNPCFASGYMSMTKYYESPNSKFSIYMVTFSNAFQYVVWNGTTSPSTAQKSQYKNHMKWLSNGSPAGTQNSCSNAYGSLPTGWAKIYPTSTSFATYSEDAALSPNSRGGAIAETAKNSYISSQTGCTDQDSNNYNPNALTNDGSCAWHDQGSSGVGKQSRKTTDGYIYEVYEDVESRLISGGSETRATISIIKRCDDASGCGVPSTSPRDSRTLPETTIWTQNIAATTNWNTFITNFNSLKTTAEQKVDEFFNAHTISDPCREQSNEWDWGGALPTSCDGTIVYTAKKKLYQCQIGGTTSRVVYTLLKNGQSVGTYTYTPGGSESDAQVTTRMNTDANNSIKTYENSLQKTSRILEDTRYLTTQISPSDVSKNTFYVVIRRQTQMIPIDPTCGNIELISTDYEVRTYTYTPIPSITPDEKRGSDGLKIIFYNTSDDSILVPTNQGSFTTLEEAKQFISDQPIAEPEVLGCLDTTANNYNPNANKNNDSCTYDVSGCMDSAANNYDSNATSDDGSCTYDVQGCTDSTALNYNPNSDEDDDSCIYAQTKEPMDLRIPVVIAGGILVLLLMGRE